MSSVSQSSINVGWLDEELRKEKAIVVGLRDLVDRQQVMLADQSQRILALEDRLTKLQGRILRVSGVEEALRNTRDELALMISDLRQDQQKREAEFLRNRQAEREHDARAIQEIRAELDRLEPLEQAIAVCQAEERRLNEVILRAQQEQEGVLKRLGQRNEAERRLAERAEHNEVKLAQLAENLTDTREGQQQQAARLLLLETVSSKAEQQVADLQNMRQELTQSREDLLEDQRRAERRRAHVMTEWRRKLENFAHQFDAWAEQLRYFADQHDKNRRVVREVQELAHEVSQQQDQLRQRQRIAEDQFRHEMREWRSENERRWAQESERGEAALEDQAQVDNLQDDRLSEVEQAHAHLSSELANLKEGLERLANQSQEESLGLKRMQVRLLEFQTQLWRDMLAEFRGLLGEEEG